MNVLSLFISETSIKPVEPKLKKGQYIGSQNCVVNSNETHVLRKDINWLEFKNYINSHFKNYPKVNTYNYACSNGIEPLCVSMMLQATNENPEKFFPIYGIDIEKDIVKDNIKNQNRHLSQEDTMRITSFLECLGKNPSEYISKGEWGNTFSNKTSAPIKYRCANILDDIDFIDSKNPSLVLCRNMWPYIKPNEYLPYAQKLYDKLAKGSCVVLGLFDYKGNNHAHSNTFPKALEEAGFEIYPYPTGTTSGFTRLIFEKN
ncbi:hypothetical protein IJ670_05740 [bacterium]|nr:hypothetical protein [bacterium]